MPTGFASLLLAVYLFFLLLPSFGQTAQPVFTELSAAGTRPSARFDAPIAYDAPARRLLLFGGQDNGPRHDLWAYSLDRRKWTELHPTGDLPPARFGHTVIFDPLRRRLLVFGGQSTGFFSDVWAYDIAQNRWQQLSSDGAGPSSRYAHSAIYDAAKDRLVISHGFTDRGRFDDTWAFPLATSTWQNLTPSGNKPLPRCLHHAVYDERNARMLLFGGCASGFGPCPLNDLWSFDLRTHQWSERMLPFRPSARQHYGMGWDRTRDRLVLFGGSGSDGLLNDTWEYDPATNLWSQLAVSGQVPAPRSRHETTFVSDLGAVVFFGGTISAGLSNELWMFSSGSNAIAHAATFLPGPAAAGQILSLFGENLAPGTSVAGSLPLPTTLAATSISIGGVPAPLYYASPLQINWQLSWELAGQTYASLTVTNGAATIGPMNVQLAPFAPGIFIVGDAGGTQGAISISGSGGAIAAPLGAYPASRPARRGEFVEIFATGLGEVTNPPPSGIPAPAIPLSTTIQLPVVTIGGIPAGVTFSGLSPGFVGLYQLNAQVPANAPSGDAVVLTMSIGGVASNAVALAVE